MTSTEIRGLAFAVSLVVLLVIGAGAYGRHKAEQSLLRAISDNVAWNNIQANRLGDDVACVDPDLLADLVSTNIDVINKGGPPPYERLIIPVVCEDKVVDLASVDKDRIAAEYAASSALVNAAVGVFCSKRTEKNLRRTAYRTLLDHNAKALSLAERDVIPVTEFTTCLLE